MEDEENISAEQLEKRLRHFHGKHTRALQALKKCVTQSQSTTCDDEDLREAMADAFREWRSGEDPEGYCFETAHAGHDVALLFALEIRKRLGITVAPSVGTWEWRDGTLWVKWGRVQWAVHNPRDYDLHWPLLVVDVFLENPKDFDSEHVRCYLAESVITESFRLMELPE